MKRRATASAQQPALVLLVVHVVADPDQPLAAPRSSSRCSGRLHRRAERDLVAAETSYGLARLSGVEVPAPDLSRAWRLLLRNEFHDVIPGSGIAEISTASLTSRSASS